MSSTRKLAAPNPDCGVRVAEFKDKNRRAESMAHSVRIKAPAYAKASAGRPAYAEATAGRQSSNKDHHAWLDFSVSDFTECRLINDGET